MIIKKKELFFIYFRFCFINITRNTLLSTLFFMWVKGLFSYKPVIYIYISLYKYANKKNQKRKNKTVGI